MIRASLFSGFVRTGVVKGVRRMFSDATTKRITGSRDQATNAVNVLVSNYARLIVDGKVPKKIGGLVKSETAEKNTTEAFIDSELADFNKFICDEMLQSHDKDIQAQATYIFENQGKLLRPKFALLLAKALLGSENDTSDKLYKVKVWSAVVEIIHNSSLLQDDIIDEASLRRGRPTAHTLFGVTNTSILPLYIVGRAGQKIYELNVPGLYEIYASAIAELPHGEYLQIKARKTIEGLPLDGQASYDQLFQEYLEKSHYKTGSLFTNLLLGTALICQGKYCQKTFELITNLGVNLGLSFQIADDLKDIRPDKQELVKDALNDLRERNTTAPYLLTLSQLTQLKSPRVKDVMQILQKKDKESGDIELVFKELKQHGTEEKTRDMIEFHYREAQKSFDLLTKDPLLRELLVKLSQPFLKI